MIRITYISAIDGKASTRTYRNHADAVTDWNAITVAGHVLAATMTDKDTGRIMRAHSSGSFMRACERSTWAN